MQHYRIDGHIYYITTNVYASRTAFHPPRLRPGPCWTASTITAIGDGFKIIGFVIMPDHIHLIGLAAEGTSAAGRRSCGTSRQFTAVRIIRQAEVEGQHGGSGSRLPSAGDRDRAQPAEGVAG